MQPSTESLRSRPRSSHVDNAVSHGDAAVTLAAVSTAVDRRAWRSVSSWLRGVARAVLAFVLPALGAFRRRLVASARPRSRVAPDTVSDVRVRLGLPRGRPVGRPRLLAAVARPRAMRWWARASPHRRRSLARGRAAYIFARYHAFLDHRRRRSSARRCCRASASSSGVDRGSFAAALAAPVALRCRRLACASRRLAPASRRGGARLALDLAAFALVVVDVRRRPGDGDQVASPDVLYLAAMGQPRARALGSQRDGRADPPGPADAALRAAARRRSTGRRNVLFVVTEIGARAVDVRSVRRHAAAATPVHQRRCSRPLSASADARARLDDRHLARGPVERPRARRRVARRSSTRRRSLWEYAHAAGFRHGVLDVAEPPLRQLRHVARGPSRSTAPSARRRSSRTRRWSRRRRRQARRLRASATCDNLPEPFVGVVHLSNTHFPYVIDDADAPFLPASRRDRARVRGRRSTTATRTRSTGRTGRRGAPCGRSAGGPGRARRWSSSSSRPRRADARAGRRRPHGDALRRGDPRPLLDRRARKARSREDESASLRVARAHAAHEARRPADAARPHGRLGRARASTAPRSRCLGTACCAAARPRRPPS